MLRVEYARQLFYREKDVFSVGCKVPATILFKQQTEFSAMAQMCTTYQKVFFVHSDFAKGFNGVISLNIIHELFITSNTPLHIRNTF